MTSNTDIRSEWFNAGFERGSNIASWTDIPDLDEIDGCADWCGACETNSERAECIMREAASESESINRDFSPFEFTAHEINSLPEFESEEAWEDFDEGISEGIDHQIAKRIAAYFA